MAQRTTRNRLRYQLSKAVHDCDRIQEHLRTVDEIASGDSTYINKYLPDLVALVSHMQKVLDRFRDCL